jgi:pseudaminic acid biosynthesis-associated methylase
MTFKTEQEAFWASEFRDDYTKRNRGEALVASNLALFARALRRAHGLNSCIEFGANVGLNLKALKLLFPGQEQHAVEINPNAATELGLVIPPARLWDLVLTKGVLIHINPQELPSVYDKLVAACGRYLLVCEYYNPSPVAISYRGHADRLFKRDFAGEILERHPRMQLVDYGFVYRRDCNFPQDDTTWFLLDKRG